MLAYNNDEYLNITFASISTFESVRSLNPVRRVLISFLQRSGATFDKELSVWCCTVTYHTLPIPRRFGLIELWLHVMDHRKVYTVTFQTAELESEHSLFYRRAVNWMQRQFFLTWLLTYRFGWWQCIKKQEAKGMMCSGVVEELNQ